MSIDYDMFGGLQRCKPILLSTTSVFDIVIGAGNDTVVQRIVLANSSGGALQTDVFFYDGSSTFLVGGGSVPANGYLPIELDIRLWEGEKIQAQEGTTGNLVTARPVLITLPPHVPGYGTEHRWHERG